MPLLGTGPTVDWLEGIQPECGKKGSLCVKEVEFYLIFIEHKRKEFKVPLEYFFQDKSIFARNKATFGQ